MLAAPAYKHLLKLFGNVIIQSFYMGEFSADRVNMYHRKISFVSKHGSPHTHRSLRGFLRPAHDVRIVMKSWALALMCGRTVTARMLTQLRLRGDWEVIVLRSRISTLEDY
jgi:hypothetical protein